jgi:hypothetical protein
MFEMGNFPANDIKKTASRFDLVATFYKHDYAILEVNLEYKFVFSTFFLSHLDSIFILTYLR